MPKQKPFFAPLVEPESSEPIAVEQPKELPKESVREVRVDPSRENKLWTCMTPISSNSETWVEDGYILDEIDRTKKIHVEKQFVPARTFILAGSTISKSDSQARQSVRAGVYVPAGERKHFNLEDVFAGNMVNLFSDKKGDQVGLADALRAYSIHTLEALVNNDFGVEPFTEGMTKGGSKIRAQELLYLWGDKEQVKAWIDAARELIAK